MQQMAVCARQGSLPVFHPQVRLSKTKTYPVPAINPLLKSDNSHSGLTQKAAGRPFSLSHSVLLPHVSERGRKKVHTLTHN